VGGDGALARVSRQRSYLGGFIATITTMEGTHTTDTDITVHVTITEASPIMGTGTTARATITVIGIIARVTRTDTTARVSTMAAIGTTGMDTIALVITGTGSTGPGGNTGLAIATVFAGEVRSSPSTSAGTFLLATLISA
jgi:hypothetical protein